MNIKEIAGSIIERSKEVPATQSMLVGISGIDGSGKGYFTNLLARELRDRGLRIAVTNVDGWLHLPDVRFDPDDLPGHFYRNGIRFDEMFDRLILPLRVNRSVDIVADFTEETELQYRRHSYNFSDIDVILLEGIFLFKREFTQYFDLKIWIECSFETALGRAIERSQEGLQPEDTIWAYETIYFPAQRLHIQIDDPQDAADLTIDNNQ